MSERKANIYFCTASRSERGLIEPLLHRLGKKFELKIVELPMSLPEAYVTMEDLLKKDKPDLVFTPFDRIEMLGASLGCLTSNVPTAQIHAGDISVNGAWDDVTRHIITLGSSFQFCMSEESHSRAKSLLSMVGKSIEHCYQVKPIHFDDIEVDISVTPDEPFDLIVYNPPTTKIDEIYDDLWQIEELLEDKPTVWIEPNGDEGSNIILETMADLQNDGKIISMKSVPRPQFLGLLARCERAIGNSSSFFLELPYFGKTHIQIGSRNMGRESFKPEDAVAGGSDEIVKLLETYL